MDDAHQKQVYKLVRYVKENKDDTSDAYVQKFTQVDGYNPDLIDVPEEFADLPFDDMEHIRGRKLAARSLIRNKTNKSMVNYDAWRCFDRKVLKGDGKHYGVATITMAPAALVRTFGIPALTQILAQGSGQFDFEDS